MQEILSRQGLAQMGMHLVIAHTLAVWLRRIPYKCILLLAQLWMYRVAKKTPVTQRRT